MQEATIQNGEVIYQAKGYTFKFKDNSKVYYQTLIARPNHIQVLTNDTKYDDKQLANKIIDKWFAEENESIREHNNAKRRESNAKKRGE